ncbi:Uncharacterised protein [Mycobacteroides abscessus subsp. abscessus]|nr:Uncharacterised protein [Mycobacteroides abscessus subsp. abscessus]SKT98819.1 Uncharacterised protein [Mycobacteroides abscessus subsp. abscessus]SKV10862.1 Uncharacterised protein [Mycobacteroides abscessus subsp. abscessus]
MARTVVKTSATRTPLASAVSAAAAIIGPSIIGSEYAIPTSMMSQPPRTRVVISSIEVSRSG